ncbi:EamA family transporter [Marinisporobacter balticus]|nr:EamA family transporter [Marinisporobacter balticus]
MKFIPIILVVLSSTCYHVSQKATPSGISPIVALIVTYVTASIVSIISYFVFVPKSDFVGLMEAVKTANWASFLLGFAVVGLELGFLLAYRAGWQISGASLLCNTLVALMLIPIGLLFFKETISLTSIMGVVICITGLVFISR